MNSHFAADPMTEVSPPDALGDLCLANADLVLPDQVTRGAITIEAGVITGIDTGDHVPDGAVNCSRRSGLMPGLVELHTDNLERHIEPRPGVDWPHAAGDPRP